MDQGFYFFLEGKLWGRYPNPTIVSDRLPEPNICFYCRCCGEVYARRIQLQPGRQWCYLHGTCKKHRAEYSVYQYFAYPFEYRSNEVPLGLVAAEFVFNSEKQHDSRT